MLRGGRMKQSQAGYWSSIVEEVPVFIRKINQVPGAPAAATKVAETGSSLSHGRHQWDWIWFSIVD